MLHLQGTRLFTLCWVRFFGWCCIHRLFCRFFLDDAQILFSSFRNNSLALLLQDCKELRLDQSFSWIDALPMGSHMLAQWIFYEILGYFNSRFKDVKLNASPHFDAPKVISPETKGDDVPKIDVNIVAKEAVHHDSIVILHGFVGLTILIQDVICEAYHMEGDKAHAQLVEHLKSILVFVSEWIVSPNINENGKIHPAQEEQLQTRAAINFEHQIDVDDSSKDKNEVKSS